MGWLFGIGFDYNCSNFIGNNYGQSNIKERKIAREKEEYIDIFDCACLYNYIYHSSYFIDER